MKAQDYWTIFMETGAPEVYLLYNQARRMEEADVCNDTGACITSLGIQRP